MADSYVCTSISDAQPSTCLEALGCGTPIIGFNNSGVSYIAPNKFGKFVDCGDVNALFEAIINVPQKTQDVISECHNYAKERFSIEASEKRYVEFLEQIIDKVRNNQ